MRALFDTAIELRPALGKREFRLLAEALGKAACNLDGNVLKPIYREHRDLWPTNMPFDPPLGSCRPENTD